MAEEIEIIDLEAYSKEGKSAPKNKKYRIKIDREVYVVEKECMTGRDLLLLAGKTPPEKYLRWSYLAGHFFCQISKQYYSKRRMVRPIPS